ncbi:MFS transporter [Methylobacterium sp. JK268]
MLRAVIRFYPNAEFLPIVTFNAAIFCGMWISKTVHPLWFEYNKKLENFGASYAAMALAGVFSGMLGLFVHRIGFRRSLIIACSLYSLGLLLRVSPDCTSVAVLSGCLSGLGASTILFCLRLWIYVWPHVDLRTDAIAASNAARGISQAASIAIAGLGLWLLGSSPQSYITMLAISSSLPLIALLVCDKEIVRVNKYSYSKTNSSLTYGINEINLLDFALICLSLLSGFSASLIVPYMPVILLKSGLSIGQAVALLAASALLASLIQPFLASVIKVWGPRRWVLAFGCMCGISTLCLAPSMGILNASVALLMRGVATGGVLLCQRTIEISLISEKKASSVLGMLSSSFLLGDMLGGISVPFFFQNNINQIIYISAIIDVVTCIAFFKTSLMNSRTNHR